MSRKLIDLINLGIVGVLVLISLITMGLAWNTPSDISVSEAEAKQRALPKNGFAQKKEAYDGIKETLQLTFGTPPLQLPNLRNLLIYYGPGDRPDIPKESTILHFSLASGKGDSTSVIPGDKLFLMYDRNLAPAQYVFSPENNPTPIWVEGEPKDKEVIVKVGMLNEEGKHVSDPDGNAQFSLQEREYTRAAGSAPWEIGKWRVDGTILATTEKN